MLYYIYYNLKIEVIKQKFNVDKYQLKIFVHY